MFSRFFSAPHWSVFQLNASDITPNDTPNKNEEKEEEWKKKQRETRALCIMSMEQQ